MIERSAAHLADELAGNRIYGIRSCSHARAFVWDPRSSSSTSRRRWNLPLSATSARIRDLNDSDGMTFVMSSTTGVHLGLAHRIVVMAEVSVLMTEPG